MKKQILSGYIALISVLISNFVIAQLPARAPSQTLYEIINLEGKVVEATRRMESNQISVQHLSPGLYFLRLINGHQSAVFKIIRAAE